jgi:hypothetical protein
MLSQRTQIGSRRIETPIGFTQYEENNHVCRRRNKDGDKSRDHARHGLGLRSSRFARIALGRLRVREVVLQPTDELSHDDDPAVSF